VVWRRNYSLSSNEERRGDFEGESQYSRLRGADETSQARSEPTEELVSRPSISCRPEEGKNAVKARGDVQVRTLLKRKRRDHGKEGRRKKSRRRANYQRPATNRRESSLPSPLSPWKKEGTASKTGRQPLLKNRSSAANLATAHASRRQDEHQQRNGGAEGLAVQPWVKYRPDFLVLLYKVRQKGRGKRGTRKKPIF